MRIMSSIATICLSAASVCTHADTPATEAANLTRVEKYAGAPVENFTMWSMYKWQGLLGRKNLRS